MKSIATVLAILCLAGAASAKQDPTKVTCEAFAAQTPEAQERVAAYLDGYSKGGKKIEDVGEIDVNRQLDVMVVSCKEAPKLTLWDKFKMHMPGGSKTIEVPMTCEDYVALGSDVQPEAAYFLAGYNRAKKAEVAAAGEVDMETDVALLVQECKPTPKESLWAKIKKHF
jgi:HdeA/HdeB family